MERRAELELIRKKKKPPVGKPSPISVSTDFKKVEVEITKESPMTKFTKKKLSLEEQLD